MCRLPISLSGTELANQLLIRAEDFNGNQVEEFGFTLTRYLLSPGDYPQPVITAPDPAAYYGGGQPILMDASPICRARWL